MPSLRIYQSLWAMELRRPDGVERPIEESFEMVADAGFDGVAADLGSTSLETARSYAPLYERHQLDCMINAFPSTLDELERVLLAAKEMNAKVVNIIGQVMPFTIPEAVSVVQRWMEDAECVGVPIQFETHRNCITNDLFFTLQLLDAVPNMPLCADLSHYLVDREFWYPISAADDALIDRILRRADSFQGRVASREQVQLQLNFPQHQKWVSVFKDWWQRGFNHWRARAQAHDECLFLCELGPPEYAMTGPDGYELSDRWDESLQLKQWAQELWDMNSHD